MITVRLGRRYHFTVGAPSAKKAQVARKRSVVRAAGASPRTTRVRAADQPMTEAQLMRARSLAITRNFTSGLVSTRVERDAAIQQVLQGATRGRANAVLAKLRLAPPAKHRWQEQTAAFKFDHAQQVKRLTGGVGCPRHYTMAGYRARYRWPLPASAAALQLGPLDEHDQRLVDYITTGRLPAWPTPQALQQWYTTRATRFDAAFEMPVLVGSW